MSDNKPKPQPVQPSNSPGTPIRKGPTPVPPSQRPGSSLPFGEPRTFNKIK